MALLAEKTVVAKPFLKWAGGKGQLLDEIEKRLPQEMQSGNIDTYVEPFVGGGAVFFFVAQKCEFIKNLYLFDINQDLVNCYNTVKDKVEPLIVELKLLENQFIRKKESGRRDFYLIVRDKFNKEKTKCFGVETAAKLIFLNKTCFNGLYRVNRKNEFNVPFGGYENPKIYDEEKLYDLWPYITSVK